MDGVRIVGAVEGQPVREATLVSPTGARVAIMSWGVTLRDWQVPVGDTLRPVVLGFPDFAPYPRHGAHFGAICGRVANRIAHARFSLGGETHALDANWRGHTLHGGARGLSQVNWALEHATDHEACFTYMSPDGDGGFPGTVRFSATYRWAGTRLRLELAAEPDRPTPVSLVQHHYFNLGTGPEVLDHRVTVPAEHYTEPGPDLLPTGAILPVAGTRYDFRAGRTLRDAAGQPLAYDVNLVLPEGRDPAAPVAVVEAHRGDLVLRLWSDRPGLQLYDSPTLDIPVPGHGGRRHGPYAGLCLEDQAWPGALAQPHFPSIIVSPDRPYSHWCEIEISPP